MIVSVLRGDMTMYMKSCQRCKKNSYGSCEFVSWNCPSCSQDLTEGKPYAAIPDLDQRTFSKKKRIKIYVTHCKIDKVV